MSALPRSDQTSAILRRVQAGARRRLGIDTALHALPWLLVAAALGWRSGAAWWLFAALALLAIAMCALAWMRLRRIDGAWIARRLDATRANMEDSAALLSRDASALPPMVRLQQQRLQTRLAVSPQPDLRPPWRRRSIGVSAALAVVTSALIAVAGTPASQVLAQLRGDPVTPASSIAPPRLVARRIDVTPPPYTRLPTRTQPALSARVPQASTMAWTLRFAPAPTAAAIVFLDGARLPLVRRGDDWTATRRIDRAALYRIETTPSAPRSPVASAPLHRIDVIADLPPLLRALQPERSLSVRGNGQRAWSLVFEGDDDYGIDARAQLRITRTEGSGENISVTTSTVALVGTGTATRRRFARSIDLGAIGLTAGDDLIVQLEVTDNRAPVAQRTRSPSYILRWPPEPDVATSGLEGLLTKTMPAYFRSQRQIIIDAEALQKDKRRIDRATFAKRADSIGGDQRLLRGRYSQFLGGEDEGAPVLPTNDDPPTADAPASGAVAEDIPSNDMPTNDAPRARAATPTVAHDDHAPADAASASPPPDAHDHAGDSGQPPQAPAFGSAGDVLDEFGHVHDQPEATTLLDPATRETLRAALDQMWQSEVNLGQARPDLALPFAYKALGFIKQVQEATRVYLARTAIAPPPIDESRRLGGDRTGLGDARDGLVAATAADPAPAAAWRALQEVVASPRGDAKSADGVSRDVNDRAPAAATASDAQTLGPALDALQRWARSDAARVRDPLALAAAIDAVRQAPDCADCRDALRRALWPALAPQRAAIGPRPRGDRAGQAYLDALDAEGSR